MKTLVVMPAYNEAGTIRGLCARVLAQPIQRLLLVDDGSTDGTADLARDLDLEILTNTINLGKGASLRRGLRHAHALGADQIVTIDADGQHDPADIPRLIAAAQRHPDRIVIAARLLGRAKSPPHRRFGNDLADFWISWACAQPVRDSQSGFRLYPRALLERLDIGASASPGFVFESEILIDAAARGIGSLGIPIETHYDMAARKSHYRPLHDTAGIVRMVAAKLIRRGLYPAGLWRSLRTPLQPPDPSEETAQGRFPLL